MMIMDTSKSRDGSLMEGIRKLDEEYQQIKKPFLTQRFQENDE